jgi:hypothetical protein
MGGIVPKLFGGQMDTVTVMFFGCAGAVQLQPVLAIGWPAPAVAPNAELISACVSRAQRVPDPCAIAGPDVLTARAQAMPTAKTIWCLEFIGQPS